MSAFSWMVAVDINQLAKRAEVSVATVSRALNGRPAVSPETRRRILALAEELGYVPNASARTLARRRSALVGLLWDTEYRSGGQQHPFLQDVLVGLKQALSEQGQGLILLPLVGRDDHNGYVQQARAHNLAGVVLMAEEPTPQVAALLASDIPCVGLDQDVTGPASTSVSSDNAAGAGTAVRHLHALGHRRIATITGPLDMRPAAERLAGYRAALDDLGLPYRDEYVVAGDFFPDSGAAAMRRLLALDTPPTAVFVAGDAMAVAGMHAAADAGLSVPEDIAVVGFDDIEAAALVHPGLTTVAQDYRELGVAAVAALTSLAAASVAEPVILPTRLVVRESCGTHRPVSR